MMHKSFREHISEECGGKADATDLFLKTQSDARLNVVNRLGNPVTFCQKGHLVSS